MGQNNTIIYYESKCPFCNICRTFIEKRDTQKHCIFKDISLFEIEKKQEITSIGSIVVVHDETYYQKFLACRKIAQKMKAPWPTIGFFLGIFPRSMGDWGYDWAANNRPFLMKIYGFLGKS